MCRCIRRQNKDNGDVKDLLKTLALAFIGVPLLAHGVSFVLLILAGLVGTLCDEIHFWSTQAESVLTLLLFPLGSLAMFVVGKRWVKYTKPELNNALCHCLLLLPALLVLVAWVIIMQYNRFSFSVENDTYGTLFFFSFPWWGIDLISVISGWHWGMVVIPAGSQIFFTLGYYWQCRHKPVSGNGLYIRNFLVAVLFIFIVIALWQAKLRADKFAFIDGNNSLTETLYLHDYQLKNPHNKLTVLRGAPTLRITQHWPRLDGATAALPLYASAFYGLNVLPAGVDDWNYLYSSRTPDAYNRIIDNKVDIIFVAQPSRGQKQQAADASVNLIYTPFAREAFVFIVNADNPVNSLTEQQARDIFSGKIVRWRDIGGHDESIQIWQRPQDSGSQTVMLAKVMKQTPMLPAKETEVASGMDGAIRKVADYQNTRGAIGYTFRYYATKMNADKGIKLLAINGIAPTVENIRNGSYPYTVDVYMVTREHPTPETQKLVDWFLSPQGQRLVQDVGYVPLYKIKE